MSIGEKIRIEEKKRLKKTAEFAKKLEPTLRKIAALKAACPHATVVVLCSAYRGSRSYDHEDAHDELRLCVDCGARESGPIFARLKSPFRRFEFGGSISDKLSTTPLAGHDLLAKPLSELKTWIDKNGYACQNR